MREFQLAASYREEGNVPGALQRLQVAIELYPDNVRAHLLLAVIHMGREDHRRAEASARDAIRILEGRQDMASMLAEARNVLGMTLNRQQRYDEAIAILRSSATDMLNTAPWNAYGNLGEAHYEKREYREALEVLEQAVRAQPRFCLGHFLMGKTYFALEQFEEADQSLTRSLEADALCESFQEAWKLRGETRARLGDREGAISDFERCVALDERTDAGRTCKRLLEAD